MLLLAVGVVNNNSALSRPSQGEFIARLDDSLRRSTDWVTFQPPEGNGYLTYMVRDCALMSKDPKLFDFVKASMGRIGLTYMARLAEPEAPFVPYRGTAPDDAYHRWIAYGLSRGEATLSPADQAGLWEPDKARTGRATHQLYSLLILRNYQGATPELNRLIRHIAERIAGEAALDFRVTDLYLQRISFLLAAGHPDLVQPRWVERALAGQDASGGWFYHWYYWAPAPYRLNWAEEPDMHATAQGMWLAYLLKYRYPEWIERHYR